MKRFIPIIAATLIIHAYPNPKDNKSLVHNSYEYLDDELAFAFDDDTKNSSNSASPIHLSTDDINVLQSIPCLHVIKNWNTIQAASLEEQNYLITKYENQKKIVIRDHFIGYKMHITKKHLMIYLKDSVVIFKLYQHMIFN